MKKIRVLIVEDSRVIRELLVALVGGDPRLEVVAAVESAEEALGLLHRLSPDVISMDIRLPGMNGLEATERIMAERPTPIVVVSASVESEDLRIAMNALRAGALSVVEKPVGTSHADYEKLSRQLCSRLANMSEVKLVRRRGGSPRWRAGTEVRPIRRPLPRRAHYRAVGVAASTGGPKAIAELLGGLGPAFPLPILLVQHIGVPFVAGFVAWLDGVSSLNVVLARDGARPEPGTVYVAPGERHLELVSGRLRLTSGPLVSGQRPSGTVLFQSMARDLADEALSVLLTGMGDDGARGLLEVRDAGGYTIAEDAATAVVYGMPRAAMELDAACESLRLEEIAPRVSELVRARVEAS